MNLTCLRYYVVAVQEKNLSKAAGKLFISRQALSKTIKRLEEELGVSLITSNIQGIEVTVEGKILYEASQQILSLWDKTTQHIQNSQSPVTILRVGYGHNSYNIWDRNHHESYMRLNPSVQIQFVSLLPDQLLEELKNKKLDLVISNVRPRNDEFLCSPIVPCPKYAMLSKHDSLANRQSIHPLDLQNRLIYFLPHDQTGMMNFAQIMGGYGIDYLTSIFPDSTITTICNEIAYHSGIFLTSAIFWKTNHLSDFVLIPFHTGLPHSFYNFDVNAITLRSDTNRKEIKDFVEYLKTHVKPEFIKK